MAGPDPQLVACLTRALRAHGQGDFPQAEAAYREVLALDPDQPDAWCNLGEVLRRLGRLDEALVFASGAIGRMPTSPLALRTLGLVLGDRGDLSQALSVLRRALTVAPEDPLVLSALADLHHRASDDEAALAFHWAALEQSPSHPDLQVNAAYGLLRLGQLEGAEARLRPLLGRGPRARWLLAYTRLLQDRWTEAWPHFQARLDLPEARENVRSFEAPRWDGTPFPDRTLLVWGEQGLGDALMTLRLLPRVKALGGRVIVLSYASLLPVLRASLEAEGWIAEGEALPPFDLQVPLLDLPGLLGLSPDTAGPWPPLCAPPNHQPSAPLVEALERAEGRRIGLVWAGNPRHIEDRHRSLDPGILAPLASVPDTTWFSLQVPPRGLPELSPLVDLGPLLRDFADTAWVLERLDAVVTVDTAVAHLAGAMGRPTHLLLPFYPDWRWGWEGARTPWYDSILIYRQPRAGDWITPLDHLRKALA